MLGVSVVVYRTSATGPAWGVQPSPATVVGATGDRGDDVTALLEGAPKFATAAVGGFADCTITLRGDQRRRLPYLALVRIMLGPNILYEGQIEDADPSGTGDDLLTTVTCLGLRNLLVENTVRRIWSKRDLDWQAVQSCAGSDGTNTVVKRGDHYSVAAGQFDPTDLTLTGIEIRGAGAVGNSAAGEGHQAEYRAPAGLSLVRIMGDWDINGSQHVFCIFSSDDGSTWSRDAGPAGNSTGSFDNGLTHDAFVRISMDAVNAEAITQALRLRVSNIRILGTTVTEDAAGGFYGGTVLRDLIALIPGLTAGVIEDGSDFTVQAIERAVRDTALSVVEEISGYYTREWAIWEAGRFDWKARLLDAPDWLVTVQDCKSLDINGTLDGIARTVYVLYTDAASGLDTEASAASTAQRNPYVKNGRTKDLLVRPGFPMTANTSAQLASRLAGDIGNWVPVQGTITLPATSQIARPGGMPGPAILIRGGDNILIADLPKTDIFQQGRDGETLFHIVSTECDLKAGTITLELEGQSTRTDVLLARLAAVTRTLTG